MQFDFAVIGAGIAGASVAAELAREASVLVVEMEDQPGYHTTGRSAAMFVPGYGPPPIRALTRASAEFFTGPPDGFCDTPLLSQRDVIMIARADQSGALEALHVELRGEGEVTILDAAALRTRHPLLRDGYAAAGLLDTSGSDIDVHALHHGFLRRLRDRGGELRTRAELQSLERDYGMWVLRSASGTFRAQTIINAAGAWTDAVGQMAGAEQIGLVPKRRTAMMIDPPEGLAVDDLPLIVDVDEAFYMKPDAGRLLISPANEDPMPPCDAQPEELDIAYCIDRIERAFDIQVRRIGTKWAGLRSFVADKAPVVGFSDQAAGFFWLAGQGGYGIQSAPALARTAAAMALGHDIPRDVLEEGLDPASLSPARLGGAA